MKEPGINTGEIIYFFNGKAMFKCIGNYKYPHVGGFGQFLFDVAEFQVTVAHKTVHTLTDHAQSLLYGLFKSSANGHNFSHAFHTASDLFGYPYEFVEVPARNFADDIVKSRFKKGRGGFGYGIFYFVQTISDAEFGGDKSQRITGSL